jgi:hypothetical protein
MIDIVYAERARRAKSPCVTLELGMASERFCAGCLPRTDCSRKQAIADAAETDRNFYEGKLMTLVVCWVQNDSL